MQHSSKVMSVTAKVYISHMKYRTLCPLLQRKGMNHVFLTIK